MNYCALLKDIVHYTPTKHVDPSRWYKPFPVTGGFWQCFTHILIMSIGFLVVETNIWGLNPVEKNTRILNTFFIGGQLSRND